MTKPAASIQTTSVFEIEIDPATGTGPASLKVRDRIWNALPASTAAERCRKAVIRWQAANDARGLIGLLRSGEADPAAQQLAADLIEYATTKKLPGAGNRELRRSQMLMTFIMAEHLGHGAMAAMEVVRSNFGLTSTKEIERLRRRYPQLVDQLRASLKPPHSYTSET